MYTLVKYRSFFTTMFFLYKLYFENKNERTKNKFIVPDKKEFISYNKANKFILREEFQ